MHAWLEAARIGFGTLQQLDEQCEALGWARPPALVAFEQAVLWPENIEAFLAWRDIAAGFGPSGARVTFAELEAWFRLQRRPYDPELAARIRLVDRLVVEHTQEQHRRQLEARRKRSVHPVSAHQGR